MDRRKLKSRSGLLGPMHRSTDSQTSKETAGSLSGSSRASSFKGSQRVSNTEMLRRKTQSASNLPNTTEETKKTPPKNTSPDKKLEMTRKTRRSGGKRSYDDETVTEKVSSPLKLVRTEAPASPITKRRKMASKITEEVSPNETKSSEEKLLSKRKKIIRRVSDSESDQENITESASPLKLRRLDPKLGSQRIESPKAMEKGHSQLSRTSQLSLKRSTQRESNISRLKKLTSPAKQPEKTTNPLSPIKRTGPTNGNKLEDFFKRSGISFSHNDEPHQLDDNPAIIIKKMIELLGTGGFKREEIVDLWRVYISDGDNLKKGLNDMMIVNSQSTKGATNFSLVKIILQIPQLQTAVMDDLLQKLTDAVLMADSMDDVPWATLLLQQFRFLEVVVETDSYTVKLENLLENCPTWFQREFISVLPDIVIDVQHHAIAEMLSKLMESNVELSSVILDCITNLTLGKEYLEELREKILNSLKNNLVIGRVPAMAKFVLYQCPTVGICEKALNVLKSLDLQPLAGENDDEYFTNQRLLVNELRSAIKLTKLMSKAATNVIKKTDDPPKPLDLIILLLTYLDVTTKKKSETTLKQHVKTGFYRSSLLISLYQDYKEVAKELQSEALQLASNLLKSEDRAYADFATEWFKSQFVSQRDTIYKQREIIEKLVLLMGNNDQTGKGALEIVRRMTESEDEMKYLQAHCNHLRILLDKIDNFDLQEVATLNDLLHALCTSDDSTSEALQDDLFILFQKQLGNATTLTKCKGVLGAVMAIKHLAGKSESCDMARDLIAKIRVNVKTCPRSRALFYDRIGSVVADTKSIDPSFLQEITERFQDEFVNDYMSDLEDYRGELVAKFGLNEPSTEPQKCVINFGDGKYGAVVPAFFRLLRICYMRSYNGSLDEINVLLGCPILMPKDMDAPEPWTLDLIICCINWFRELISGFVSQPDPVMQEQVLKRLENLMNLQAEFSCLLTMAEPRYQPPPCYFHIFPAPAFLRVEKKAPKKGKRNSVDKNAHIPEWEAWEIGSSLCSKNPNYFRQLDAKVVDLLDLKMDHDASGSQIFITKAQICFLIKELLGMFDGSEPSESLLRDLVHLLPKVCSKLQDIIGELREQDDTKNRHVANLILSLLTKIFDWKGFRSAKYQPLLRDGLRTLAGQIDKANLMLRSSKELVAESYKYFESLADVSTDISLAFAVVKMCRSLMKHSDTFTKQFKNKQANLASGFLALQWPDDKSTGATYKTAVVGFLTNWLQNEPDPLATVTTVLEWLPDEVKTLEKTSDRLERLPSITKALFHNMFQKLFENLINGIKISLAAAKTDPERIKVWQKVSCNVQKIVQICKSSSRSVLLPFLRSMTSLLRIFLASGMPVLEQNLRFQTEEVTGILKMMQGGTRYLNVVCVDCTEKKDLTLAKIVPPAKSLTEKLLFLVKGMLVYNNSSDAFWMGNLVNKNLEGQQIYSQSSSEEPTTTTSAQVSVAADSEDEAPSEILDSEIEEQLSDEDS
ncbi:Fanconi anemia group D2 protein [Venturia canescens]|uniref:Fanconi anemia group D2 protein n=1 Tax=Venturia canescens TaxID=32260 RepID=UPI001C9CBD0A|nr:Fanconi anemia group D2 protein [Venturia canescens]